METDAKITITLKESSNKLQTQIQVHGVTMPGQIAVALAKTLAAVVMDKDDSSEFMMLYYMFTYTYFDEFKKMKEDENHD